MSVKAKSFSMYQPQQTKFQIKYFEILLNQLFSKEEETRAHHSRSEVTDKNEMIRHYMKPI